MYGLEAINATNGWTMAVLGALIVMTGLALLAFVISQLHKVVDFMERRNAPAAGAAGATTDTAGEALYDPEKPLFNLDKAVEHYRKVTLDLGEQFQLKDLYTIFYHSGFPHPHLTIRTLRENGRLVSTEEGYFSWKG